MAICDYCHQDMADIKTVDCSWNRTVKYPDGVELPSVPYMHDDPRPCHDCNIERGNYHHPGCDCETCPRCHGQLISCGCLDDEDGLEVIDYTDLVMGLVD